MKTRYPKYLNRNGIPHEIALKEMEQKLKQLESRQNLVQILAKAKRVDLGAASDEGLGGSDHPGDLQQSKRRAKFA